MNIEQKPYQLRKATLSKLLSLIDNDVVQPVPYDLDLEAAWNKAVENNQEGLIVKQLESGYEHERSYSWRKVKNWRFESLGMPCVYARLFSTVRPPA